MVATWKKVIVSTNDNNMEQGKMSTTDTNMAEGEVSTNDKNMKEGQILMTDSNIEEVSMNDNNMEDGKISTWDSNMEKGKVSTNDNNMEESIIANDNMEEDKISTCDSNMEEDIVSINYDNMKEGKNMSTGDSNMGDGKVSRNGNNVEEGVVMTSDSNKEVGKVSTNDYTMKEGKMLTNDSNLKERKMSTNNSNRGDMREEDEEKPTTKSPSPRRSRSRSRSPLREKRGKYFLLMENVPDPVNFGLLKKKILENIDCDTKNRPRAFITTIGGNRCIVQFKVLDFCEKAVNVMDGLEVNGNIIRARVISDQECKFIRWGKGYESPVVSTEQPMQKQSFPASKFSFPAFKNILPTSTNTKPNIPSKPNMPPNFNMQPQPFQEGEETYGLSVKYLESLGITTMRKCILVTNVEQSTTKEHLREVFSNAGHIVNLYTMRRVDCLSAKIEYDHPVEAVQAIAMFHNRELNGRFLEVRMDLYSKKVYPIGLKSVGPGLGDGGTPLTYVRVLREMHCMREKFTQELKTLNNTLEELKSKLAAQSQISNTQAMLMQNSTPIVNSTNSQNIPLGNMFNNQTVNPPMSQNMMPNINMMQYQTGQMYSQMNQTGGQMSGQLNQIPGVMRQTTDLGLMSDQTGQIDVMHQGGQIQGQMAQVNQMHQMTGQGGSMLNQVHQMPSQVNQMTTQSGQMISQGDQMPSQVSQTTSQGGQMTSQVSPMAYQVNPMAYQGDQMTSQVSQMTTQGSQIKNQMSRMRNEGTEMMNRGGQMMNQGGQMTSQVEKLNQMSGIMRQTTDPGLMFDQTGQMSVINRAGQFQGPIAQVNQIRQMTNQVGPMPNQGDQTTNQVNHMTTHCGQMTNQIGQMINQRGQMTNQGGLMTSQLAQMGQTTNQMGQITSQMSPATTQKDYTTGQMGYTAGYNYDNKYPGNSSQSSNKESTKGRTSEMLMFHYLPPNVTERVLISKMKAIGEIKFAELTGKGKAIVRFRNEQDAARCINLFHRSKVDGQVIEVTYL